jgi:AmmeMemoRadiSam system protein A
MTEFSEEHRKFLLELARKSIINYPARLSPKDVPEILKEKKGAFVSVYVSKKLRGCIGYLEGIKPLFEAVMDNAVAAAYHDSRFRHVEKDEMKSMEVEVSVLSVPEKLKYAGAASLLKSLSSKDGLIIKSGYHQATFLPQVWEQLPEKEEFLSQLCLKAGLLPEEWQNGKLEVYTYRADVFRG